MANLDTHINRGKTDVQDKLKNAVADVQKIGDEFQQVKDGIANMPGGLDTDIQQMIADAKEQGKNEANQDVEGVKSSAVTDAKNAADSIKTDVTAKIADNTTARGKLSTIRSKYGKSAIDSAVTAIDQNTRKGNDLMKQLEDAMKDADQAIRDVQGKL